MRLGPIVLKIRSAGTRFENRVAGAAELGLAMQGTLQQEAIFVIQLAENAEPNPLDTGINQRVYERFGIIVALKNDVSDKDKTGITAYDALHEVRAEILKAILGWQLPPMESVIYYRGGRLLDINRAWLWYQFEFEAYMRLDGDDGVVQEELPYFNTIYAKLYDFPDEEFFDSEKKEYADFLHPDMEEMINLEQESINLYAGAFGRGYHTGFDWYKD